AAVLASPAGGAVLRVMLLGAPTHPRLQAMAEAFWRQRVAASDAVVHRAVDRGELPAGTDARAVVRSAVAPLYFDVLVLGRTPDERTVRLCVDATLTAIAAGTFGAGAP